MKLNYFFQSWNYSRLFIGLIFLLSLTMMGCAGLTAPDHFTQKEKIEYTTLKTLKSANIFREFALESAGTAYKKGLMEESTKEKIILLGDQLQQAINIAADTLLIFKNSGGVGHDKTLEENLIVYQALFNQFLEIVTPFVTNTQGKEVG